MSGLVTIKTRRDALVWECVDRAFTNPDETRAACRDLELELIRAAARRILDAGRRREAVVEVLRATNAVLQREEVSRAA